MPQEIAALEQQTTTDISAAGAGVGGHNTRRSGGSTRVGHEQEGVVNATAAAPTDGGMQAVGATMAVGGGVRGDKMQTRMRAGSVIKPPRHADDPPTSPSHLPLESSSSSSSSTPAPASSSSLSTATPIAPRPAGRRLSISSSSIPNLSSSSSSSGVIPPPILPASLLSGAGATVSPNPPPRSHHARPKAVTTSLATADSLFDGLDNRKHPRDFVPPTIGFPAPGMEGKIHPEDLEDKLLMATCAVLHSHENRALCPKEMAEVMLARGWLNNAGTTPFAHVSTCIRSHLRRATTSNPPYSPLLTSFELVGALKEYEVRAVGLRSEDRPAVKRGTLWYLDERVLGKQLGAEDPFIRCQREAGLSPSEKNGIYHRTLPPIAPIAPAPALMDDDDDDNGMGRGKRKRRASSAAMAALDTPVPNSASPVPILSATGTASSILATQQRPWANGHRRANSMSSGLSSSMPKLGGGMRLTLRLSALEEAVTDDSDGQTSDAVRRRKNKKKARRATSEGGTGQSRAGSSGASGDEDGDETRRNQYSSASSSALLAKSLLAASQLSPQSQNTRLQDPPSPHSVISPDSLHSGPFPHHTSHHLSISAPGLFSSFSSAASRDAMDVDSSERRFSPSADADDDSADEDDFHEAMLRGEDFDFEWSSETYAAQSSLHKKGKQREMSLDLPEHFDSFNELDHDDVSTPATTPRSPGASRDDEADVDMAASYKQGMEATLCQAFEQHKDAQAPVEVEEVKPEVPETPSRAGSAESLVAVEEEDVEDVQEVVEQSQGHTTLSVPFPSPLGLDLPPPPLGNQAFSSEYDFVGHEEDDDDRAHYRSVYDRDMAESADDEDEEDDDIVTVKIEEDGSVGPGSAPSSRQSSVYPIESFTRRLVVDGSQSPSSSDSDGDHFDPQMIVSNSMLATGLPVPQPAPSPPDTTDATDDWDMHLDLDDLDVDLGTGVDLLGPESVGLDELDLAWGGPDEQGEGETEEEWRARQESKAVARGLASGPSFLTRSPVEDRSPPPQEKRRVTSAPPPVVLPSPTLPSPPITAPSSRAETPLSRTPTVKAAATAPVIVYPKTPISPVVTATIVQRGVAVYATDMIDPETQEKFPLLRRIDTDYINGTVLLTGVFSDLEERDEVLAEFTDTFKVVSGGRAVEGTWISLSSAHTLAERYSSLSRLDLFFDDDLGSRFPEPLPSMRAQLRNALASSSSSSHTAFGFHLMDTETERRSASPRPSPAPAAKKATPSSTPRGNRGRRASTITKDKSSSEEPPKSIVSPPATGRQTRRSLAAAK